MLRGTWCVHRDERGQRGAVAVFLAVTIALLLAVAALAVDLGTQRVVRRDMQAIADVVALDMAREIDGRSQAQLAALVTTSSTSLLSQSVARNSTTLGDDLVVTADWGSWNGTTWNTTAEPPTAVKVVASASTDFAFAAGSGSATRTAYATSTTTACHALGSYAAAVRSNDSALLAPLNSLLGVDLTLVGYQGIANTEVSLAQLAATAVLGTETELLTAPVAFGDLVKGTIDVLNKEKPAGYSAAVSALGSFLAVAGSVPAVRLGSLLNISPTDSAALETGLNVLDLIAGSVGVATGQHAVAIPNLQAQVPGLGSQVTGGIFVQQGRQTACGAPNSAEARAATSQIAGDLGLTFVNLPSMNLNLGLVKGTLQTPKATGNVHLKLGNATSQLVDPPQVHCGNGTTTDPSTFSVAVASGLAEYSLTVDLEVKGTLKLELLLTSVDVAVDVGVRLTMSSPAPAATSTVSLALPPNDVTPKSTGGTVNVLSSVVPTITSSSITAAGLTLNASQITSVTTAVLDGLTNGPNAFVNKTLTPLASNLDSQLVGPVARLLGVRVGGADVFALEAVCSLPALRG